MEMSTQGLLLLKQSEGWRSTAYMDNGKLAIGYGHDLRPDESFPEGISQSEGELLLQGDLREVYAAIDSLVTVPLTQGQFDALCDFTYNLGSGRLRTSTLLKLLNQRQYDAAANELLKWDHVNGAENAGLRARRQAEYTLWRS